MSGTSDNKPIQIRAARLEQREQLFAQAFEAGTTISDVTQKFWSWWLSEDGAELPQRSPGTQQKIINDFIDDQDYQALSTDHDHITGD